MKILFLSYTYWPPDFGGELLACIERFKSLCEQGFNVAVLTSGRPGFPGSQIIDGIQIKRSPVVANHRVGRLFRRMIYFVWCLWYVSFSSYDVLHLSSIGAVAPIFSAVAAWLLTGVARIRGKSSLSVHSLAESDENPFIAHGSKGFLKSIYYANIHKIVSVSPALHIAVKKRFPEKAALIPYGIRDDVFKPVSNDERSQFRKKAGATRSDVVFTFLGSVGKRKGFDLLASAFSRLADSHMDWLLWVVGPIQNSQSSNIVDKEVEEVLQPLRGMNNRIHFWGRVDERDTLVNILSNSSIFVFPSRREGMGIAPLEAMAAGLPVIISRIPGVTDLANIDGETGFYIEPEDAEALVEAMEKLAGDQALREAMGKKARQRIVESFSWKNHVKQWEKLYDGMHN